jgi:hypothetical protein
MAGSYAVNLGDAGRSQPTKPRPQKRHMDAKDNKKRVKKQKRKRERPPWRR